MSNMSIVTTIVTTKIVMKRGPPSGSLWSPIFSLRTITLDTYGYSGWCEGADKYVNAIAFTDKVSL